ncbi:unnamed protein product, partial [Mesorhabditis spiculigera]
MLSKNSLGQADLIDRVDVVGLKLGLVLEMDVKPTSSLMGFAQAHVAVEQGREVAEASEASEATEARDATQLHIKPKLPLNTVEPVGREVAEVAEASEACEATEANEASDCTSRVAPTPSLLTPRKQRRLTMATSKFEWVVGRAEKEVDDPPGDVDISGFEEDYRRVEDVAKPADWCRTATSARTTTSAWPTVIQVTVNVKRAGASIQARVAAQQLRQVQRFCTPILKSPGASEPERSFGRKERDNKFGKDDFFDPPIGQTARQCHQAAQRLNNIDFAKYTTLTASEARSRCQRQEQADTAAYPTGGYRTTTSTRTAVSSARRATRCLPVEAELAAHPTTATQQRARQVQPKMAPGRQFFEIRPDLPMSAVVGGVKCSRGPPCLAPPQLYNKLRRHVVVFDRRQKLPVFFRAARRPRQADMTAAAESAGRCSSGGHSGFRDDYNDRRLYELPAQPSAFRNMLSAFIRNKAGLGQQTIEIVTPEHGIRSTITNGQGWDGMTLSCRWTNEDNGTGEIIHLRRNHRDDQMTSYPTRLTFHGEDDMPEFWIDVRKDDQHVATVASPGITLHFNREPHVISAPAQVRIENRGKFLSLHSEHARFVEWPSVLLLTKADGTTGAVRSGELLRLEDPYLDIPALEFLLQIPKGTTSLKERQAIRWQTAQLKFASVDDSGAVTQEFLVSDTETPDRCAFRMTLANTAFYSFSWNGGKPRIIPTYNVGRMLTITEDAFLLDGVYYVHHMMWKTSRTALHILPRLHVNNYARAKADSKLMRHAFPEVDPFVLNGQGMILIDNSEVQWIYHRAYNAKKRAFEKIKR